MKKQKQYLARTTGIKGFFDFKLVKCVAII